MFCFKVKLVLWYISTFLSPFLNMGSANFFEGKALRKDKQERSDDLVCTRIHSLKRVTSHLSQSHCSNAVSSFTTVTSENADVRTAGHDHFSNHRNSLFAPLLEQL